MSLTTRAAPRQKKRLEWTIVPELTPSASLADAIIQLKNSGSKKWKWAKSPGNGQTHSVFQCNAHVDCGHLRMAARLDGSYVIKECGTHGAEENLKKRKNSPLTFSEEDAVRSSITSGTRPASLLASMTERKVQELRAEGMDPLAHKHAEGGLTGTRAAMNMPRYVTIRTYRTYLNVFECICNVSRRYVRIRTYLIVSDTYLSGYDGYHVSRRICTS